MASEKITQVASLAIGLVCITASLLPLPVADWGLTRDGGLTARLTYSLLHANLLHALLNVWCLLSVVIIYRLSPAGLFWGWVVAAAVPSCCLSLHPTVGLSCIVYFLFGRAAWLAQRRTYYNIWMVFFILPGLFLPGINGRVHVWGYLCGLLYGLLNTPIAWIKRSHDS
jgi:membrane associated rhomboid family serine protease